MVAALLKAGADPSTVMADGWPVVVSAAGKNRPDIVAQLCDAAADLKARSPGGSTTLKLAAQSNSVPMVDTLLEAGADPSVTNSQGYTALMSAAQKGFTEVVERLCAQPGVQVDQQHPNAQDTALHFAARDNHVPAMWVLLESGAAVDALSKINATPLHLAADNGMAEATDLLIERKASLEVVATGRQTRGTPLWAAVEAGQLLVAQRLLCAGADTECERDGLVPLALACRKESLSVAMAELLLRCGARPDVFPEPDSYDVNVRPGALVAFPNAGVVKLTAHSVFFHVANGMGKMGEAMKLREYSAPPCK